MPVRGGGALREHVKGHESWKALADVLISNSRLVTNLSGHERHVGEVRDVAFLGDDFILSVDRGTGAINDERSGALCVSTVRDGSLRHRDERLGGEYVLGIAPDRIVVSQGSSLLAIRWYDDDERCGCRARWSCDLTLPGPIQHLAYELISPQLPAAADSSSCATGTVLSFARWRPPDRSRP
jgi:hypothetical protein